MRAMKAGILKAGCCQFTVKNSGKEPKSYQHRRYIFHALVAFRGYFHKV